MRILICAILSLLALALTERAAANPSDREPHAPLEVHSSEVAPQLLAQAQQLFDQNQLALGKFEELRAAGKAAAIDPLKVGQAYATVLKLRRAGEQLRQCGEPAGYDYLLRATRQATELNRIIGALQSLPQAQQAIANTRAKALQVSQTRTKQIPRLERMVEDKAWLKAEAELHDVLDELEIYLGFLIVEDRQQVTLPWRELKVTIETAAKSARQEQALAHLAARRDATLPDDDAFLADMKAAANDVRASGKHTVDGSARSGPELLAHFDVKRQTHHVQAINALATEWARAAVLGESPTPEWTAAEEKYKTFAAQLPPALAAIIEADTARISDASAKELYLQYLPVVADLSAHAPDCAAPLESALSKFSEKSPALAAEIAAYRTATSELLRWRQRVAQEQAAARAGNAKELATAAREWFARTEATGGFFEPTSPSPARMVDPVGQVLENSGPKVVGRSAVTRHITALASGTAGISRYGERVYARVALPANDVALAAAREALTRDLQAVEKPPLTLVATQALRSLARGDLPEMGGEVKAVYVEGHISRFATLPAAAALLLPLGTLPQSYTQEEPLAQVVLRFDLKPQWIANDYFFVELSGGALPR